MNTAAAHRFEAMDCLRLLHPSIRQARAQDLAELRELARTATRALCAPDYTPEQVEAVLRFDLEADARLVPERNYYVIENRGRLIAAGGWTFPALMGSSHADYARGPLEVVDRCIRAARLRGFFTHPDFARIGLARMLVGLCERAAAHAGFGCLELLATPAGRRLYRACGFEDVGGMTNIYPNGVAAPGYLMSKPLPTASALAA
jgi:GNAT superfamily N-acetyltransferase